MRKKHAATGKRAASPARGGLTGYAEAGIIKLSSTNRMKRKEGLSPPLLVFVAFIPINHFDTAYYENHLDYWLLASRPLITEIREKFELNMEQILCII